MEPSREEMDEAVRWMRGIVAFLDEERTTRNVSAPERCIVAYIDLLEKRVRELGGAP